jgi:hypothetical protein
MSRFVPAGAKPEDIAAAAPVEDAWAAARREVISKQTAPKSDPNKPDESLYDKLQANKGRSFSIGGCFLSGSDL